MAHLSGDAGPDRGVPHRARTCTASSGARVFGVEPGRRHPRDAQPRSRRCRYGLAYGLSAFGLSKQLTISHRRGAGADGRVLRPVRRGARLPARGRRRGPGRPATPRRCSAGAATCPTCTSDNRQRRERAERMALNAPIQGSAADIIKLAMLGVDAALRRPRGCARGILLQVHDELVLEVAPGEREAVEALVRREMGAAVEMDVPLDVSVGVGPELARGRPLGRRTGCRAHPAGRHPGSSVARVAAPCPDQATRTSTASSTSVDAEHEQQHGRAVWHEGHGGQRRRKAPQTHHTAWRCGRARSLQRAAGSSRSPCPARRRPTGPVARRRSAGPRRTPAPGLGRRPSPATATRPDAEDDAQAGEVQVPWPGAARSVGNAMTVTKVGGTARPWSGSPRRRRARPGRGSTTRASRRRPGQREEGEQGVQLPPPRVSPRRVVTTTRRPGVVRRPRVARAHHPTEGRHQLSRRATPAIAPRGVGQTTIVTRPAGRAGPGSRC